MTENERKEAVQFLYGLAAAAHERMNGRPNMVTILKSDNDRAIMLLFDEWYRLDTFERKIKKSR